MSKQKKPGRPAGSVQTPRKVLEADMRETASLNRKIRALISKQVEAIEKELSDSPELGKRLKAVEVLGSFVQAQTTGIDKTAKHVLSEPADGEGNAVVERAPEDVLRELRGQR